MSAKAIIITGFIIFVVIMFASTIYQKKHACEVDPNDETFLDKIFRLSQAWDVLERGLKNIV